jgi:hypothetical protein
MQVSPYNLRAQDKVVTPCAMRPALCVSKEKPMPAIASLEDLKSAQRDGRSKFLIVTPCALPFTPYGF